MSAPAFERPEANRAGRLGVVFALLSAICYGGLMPWTRLGSEAGVHAPDLAFYRVAFVGALIIPLVLALRRPLTVPRDLWPPLLGYSLCIWFIGVTYMGSVAFIPVGLAAIIFFTFPLLTALVSPFVDGTRLPPLNAVLILVAFAGLGLAIGPSIHSLDPRGLVLAAMAAAGATGMFLFAGQMAPRLPVLTVAFWVHLLLLLPAFGFAVVMGGPSPAILSWAGAIPPLVIAAGYGLGFLFQMRASAHAPAAHITQFFFIEPVAAIAAAALVLGETLEMHQYLGAVIVLAVLVAIVRRARPD